MTEKSDVTEDGICIHWPENINTLQSIQPRLLLWVLAEVHIPVSNLVP